MPLSRSLMSAGFFLPSQITGLRAWYDFSDASSIFEDTSRTDPAEANDTIKGVADKSGNGFHLSEATNGPQWIASGQNGLSVARFNGLGHQLNNTGNIVSQPDTIFVAAKYITATNLEHFFDGPDSNRQVIGDVASKFALYAGTILDTGVSHDTTARIFCGIFNGVSSKLYLSGGTPTSGAGGAASLASGIRIGNDTGAGGAFTNMDAYEYLIFNTALSNYDLNRVGNYLETKWALTWTDV